MARLARIGLDGNRSDRPGDTRHVSTARGWRGLVWYVKVRRGTAGITTQGVSKRDGDRHGWQGEARTGLERRGLATQGTAGKDWHGRTGIACPDEARLARQAQAGRCLD